MRVYLLHDRSALLVDDRQKTVTVEPRVAGVMTVDDEEFEIMAEGSPVPVTKNESGICHVKFTTEAGVVYKGERTSLKGGTPYSTADYAAGYVPLRLMLDDLARKSDELFRIAADLQPDSLGHLNIGGNEE